MGGQRGERGLPFPQTPSRRANEYDSAFPRWQLSNSPWNRATMAPYSARYEFSQRFRVPAEEAYRWSTDYQPDDWSLMGKKGKRDIKRLSENALILTDTIYEDGGRPVSKRRLVLIYPERRSWTNTHLGGPNKHSQFLYEIIPEGKNASRLDFTGFQINYDDAGGSGPPREKIESLASKLREDDSATWRLLAKAMEGDLRLNESKRATRRANRRLPQSPGSSASNAGLP
jgi:hypothetical protein